MPGERDGLTSEPGNPPVGVARLPIAVITNLGDAGRQVQVRVSAGDEDDEIDDHEQESGAGGENLHFEGHERPLFTAASRQSITVDLGIHSEFWIEKPLRITKQTMASHGEASRPRVTVGISVTDEDLQPIEVGWILRGHVIDLDAAAQAAGVDTGSVWLEDTWRQASNLSITLGIIGDHPNFFPADRVSGTASTDDTMTPRLGFSYELGAERATLHRDTYEADSIDVGLLDLRLGSLSGLATWLSPDLDISYSELDENDAPRDQLTFRRPDGSDTSDRTRPDVFAPGVDVLAGNTPTPDMGELSAVSTWSSNKKLAAGATTAAVVAALATFAIVSGGGGDQTDSVRDPGKAVAATTSNGDGSSAGTEADEDNTQGSEETAQQESAVPVGSEITIDNNTVSGGSEGINVTVNGTCGIPGGEAHPPTPDTAFSSVTIGNDGRQVTARYSTPAYSQSGPWPDNHPDGIYIDEFNIFVGLQNGPTDAIVRNDFSRFSGEAAGVNFEVMDARTGQPFDPTVGVVPGEPIRLEEDLGFALDPLVLPTDFGMTGFEVVVFLDGEDGPRRCTVFVQRGDLLPDQLETFSRLVLAGEVGELTALVNYSATGE